MLKHRLESGHPVPTVETPEAPEPPEQPDQPDEAFAWATGHGHTGVPPWEADLGADPLTILAQAKILGLEVGCYVVNDPDRMKFLSDTGLWGFVTDVPDVAVETLRRP